MKENKLPPGCKDNPVASSGGSFSMPAKVQSLDEEDPKGSIKKQFAFNRGSFSGPLETDEQATELLESEDKAEGCSDAATESA